ncbi:MAG: Fic family protein [Candidatus Melainabacteria bacterium]|jgi:Fic family protein|nr:Fic family protein [Candidatus Melainabacteria bacterium]
MDRNGQRLDNVISLDLKLQGLISSKLKNIDQFNLTWSEFELKESQEFLRELKELSTIQSIGSSTRIEGSKLQDDEIKTLIDNLDINKLKSRDEEEVSGYYEALDLIYENHENLFLSESYIKQLHAISLKYSSKDTRHRGDYKSLSNKVVAQYPDGSSRVVFDTTEPYLVAKEMTDLIDWSNERLSYSGIHSLMVIAVFVYEFLSIHPFQDGNGRLSRLLTNLLMMKSGYKFVQYISFEHVIEQRKKEYYQNLMEAQSQRFTRHPAKHGFASDVDINKVGTVRSASSANEEAEGFHVNCAAREDLGMWMVYFLDCVENLISKLKTKLHTNDDHCLDDSGVNLSSTQKQIYTLISTNKSSKVEDLMKVFPEITRPTIKYSLSRLVELGLISRHGRGRGTWYQTAKAY